MGMMSGITKEKKDIRGQLAECFLRGRGIEIFDTTVYSPLPPAVTIQRVSVSSFAEYDKYLHTCPDSAILNFDFLIANDILKDSDVQAEELLRWLQLLRPGGILLLLVRDHLKISGEGRGSKRHFLSGTRWSSWNPLPASTRSNLRKDNILTLSVRVRWQGSHCIDGSREYIVVLERFDYVIQIQDLLRKKLLNPNSQSASIDVIIPVFNAYDDLLRCLYSVMLHHDCERVILIDDRSTDPRIGALFSDLEPFHSSWFVLIRQKKNRGFAATVNLGMNFSRNDVILLNSDTIVTRDWVKKMKEVAGSLKNCATLTPLSNNGAISSVPVLMVNNQLMSGTSIAGYADMVESISLQEYPVVPTGIGFCLYITRASLDLTGNFDEVNYGKGYGEETDFCLRATIQGMTHHICDSTYIYHRGMASFTDMAKLKLEDAIATLNAQYPLYKDEISSFLTRNPLEKIQKNIAIRSGTWDYSGCKIRILFALSSEDDTLFRGLIEEYGAECMVYVLRYSQPEYILSEYNNGTWLEYFFLPGSTSYKDLSDLFENVFRAFRISRIYLDNPRSKVRSVAEKLSIPCTIASEFINENEKKPSPIQITAPGDFLASGLPDNRDAIIRKQEPDQSSGSLLSSGEIFRSIRAYPGLHHSNVISCLQGASGSLPARFFRCLKENGLFYTLRMIGFFIIHGQQ